MKISVSIIGSAKKPFNYITPWLSEIYPDAQVKYNIFTWEEDYNKQYTNCFSNPNIYLFSYKKQLEIVNYINKSFSVKFFETNVISGLSMFRIWDLSREILNYEDADLFIKYRPDGRLISLICNSLNTSRLIIPAGGDFRGGIGDHFCAGPKKKLLYYLNIFNKLYYYAQIKLPFHPEWLLRYHLIDEGFLQIERPIIYLFARDKFYQFDGQMPNEPFIDDRTVKNMAEIGKTDFSHLVLNEK